MRHILTAAVTALLVSVAFGALPQEIDAPPIHTRLLMIVDEDGNTVGTFRANGGGVTLSIGGQNGIALRVKDRKASITTRNLDEFNISRPNFVTSGSFEALPQKGKPTVLRANRLEIVDDEGNVLGVFGAKGDTRNNQVFLQMRDELVFKSVAGSFEK